MLALFSVGCRASACFRLAAGDALVIYQVGNQFGVVIHPVHFGFWLITDVSVFLCLVARYAVPLSLRMSDVLYSLLLLLSVALRGCRLLGLVGSAA